MKRTICLTILFFVCALQTGLLFGQQLVVSAARMNIAYVGIDNPITVSAEEYTCEQLEVTCNECEIKKIEGCKYIVKVNKEGRFDIVIRAKTNRGLKQIGTTIFRSRLLPKPIARIAGKSQGIILLSAFKAQKGIDIRYDEVEYECLLIAEKFKIEFFRNNILLSGSNVIGPYFNVEVQNQMKTLKAGDKVVVSEVVMLCPSCRSRRVNDIHLTLN